MSLQLRKIHKDDLEMIMNWRMLPEVTKYMYTDPQLDMEKQLAWFNQINKDEGISSKYWIIEFNRTPIGLLSLNDIDRTNKRSYWAYYIANTSFRGMGIGSNLECNIYNYVFYTLGLNKLCCEVLAFNDGVVKLHQKYGSEIEGILKQHIYKNGEFLDVVIMGITKDKWEQIKGNYKYEKIEIE